MPGGNPKLAYWTKQLNCGVFQSSFPVRGLCSAFVFHDMSIVGVQVVEFLGP